MIKDIEKQLELIEKSLEWAERYEQASFPKTLFKDYRRKLKKIRFALEENCSAAAYGESQVGKSYLMSSLLSSPSSPFCISDGEREYSFIDEINPSGGNTSKEESTGVITRFTARCDNPAMKKFVKIRTLSVVDIISMLTDSYYKDVKIDMDTVLRYDEVNRELESVLRTVVDKNSIQTHVTEDDVKDIHDYMKSVIGNNAAALIQSDFCNLVAPVVRYVKADRWVDVFSLLWNRNPELSRLFSLLIGEYRKLGFNTEVYVPFTAVLREKGTLLKVNWLDSVCGKTTDIDGAEPFTDVYDRQGNLLAQNFGKAYLSALTAELTFILPEQAKRERRFLEKLDLLDFPGARRRENIYEANVGTELPTILRRGKVAYLFNKYSRALRISSILFCHHNDMTGESEIGETLNDWIEANLGKTPEARTAFIANTNGISPFFLIATKFNIELKWTNETKEKAANLASRWKSRFDKTLAGEVIKSSTYSWFDKWVTPSGNFRSPYFRNIYLLRDFFWSRDQHVFSGYEENKSPEKEEIRPAAYPDYREDLKRSFVDFPFVRNHFESPEKAWDDAATLNNDGSKAIIASLDGLAPFIDDARKKKYLAELKAVQEDVLARLSVFFVPGDPESAIESAKTVAGDIQRNLDLAFGMDSSVFGNIISRTMVQSAEIRRIVYDIIMRYVEVPKDMTAVNTIRMRAGIDPAKSREENLATLCRVYHCDVATLNRDFERYGITVDDVVAKDSEVLATESDVVAKHILDYWMDALNSAAKDLENILPHSGKIVFMLIALFQRLEVKSVLHQSIDKYINAFDREVVPNVIADSASLILNNFVSTVGWEYMKPEDVEKVRRIAGAYGVEVDLENEDSGGQGTPQSLTEVLHAFDEAPEIMRRQSFDGQSISRLRKLPLWDNFLRWENRLVIGLLYTSDVVDCDPEANAAIKEIMEECKDLYK